MQVNLIGRYFNINIEIDAELLRKIWESPELIGGGAERFRLNSGQYCWITSEGWGFMRVGSISSGIVEFVDPMPGRGRYASACSGKFQYPTQHTYPHGESIFV